MDRYTCHDPKTPQGNACCHPKRHRKPQSPGTNGAAGQFSRLDRNGNQGWLGHRRTEADSEREQVYPVVLLPVDDLTRLRSDKGRVSELLGHQATDREQGLLQPDQKQHKAEQHKGEASQEPLRVRQRPAQDRKLEENEDRNDWKNVAHGLDKYIHEYAQRIHQMSIP